MNAVCDRALSRLRTDIWTCMPVVAGHMSGCCDHHAPFARVHTITLYLKFGLAADYHETQDASNSRSLP